VDGSNSIRIDGTIALRHYQVFTGYRGPNGQAEHPMPHNGHVARAATTTGMAMAAVSNVPGRPSPDTREATKSFVRSGHVCRCCSG